MTCIAFVLAMASMPMAATPYARPAGAQQPTRPTNDLSGLWQLTLTEFGQTSLQARLELTSDGSRLSGTAAAGAWNELKVEGSIEGDVVTLHATVRGKPFATFTGRVHGDEIRGTATDGAKTFGWHARRMDTAARPAQTHTFVPATFARVFSADIEPVLRIRSGDSVRTWTVDAGGRDAAGVERSLPGNPQTGPFHVEGAMPGDALAITFTRLGLNRDSAFSGKWIVPSAVTPLYFKTATLDGALTPLWQLDRQAGHAVLRQPTAALREYRVPLAPMLGGVAVAPGGGQAFSTHELGLFGGNLDYNQLREGVTVYLPVFVPGALVFVGDGHAAQGDGELNGNALETSMDVEFSVSVIPNGAPLTAAEHGPRFENAEWLMASGIANSLARALQRATSALARWVKQDYALSDTEVALVLGTGMRYDIAAVAGEQMHVVAKIDKRALGMLRR
jgi:amidase